MLKDNSVMYPKKAANKFTTGMKTKKMLPAVTESHYLVTYKKEKQLIYFLSLMIKKAQKMMKYFFQVFLIQNLKIFEINISII